MEEKDKKEAEDAASAPIPERVRRKMKLL